MQPSVVYIFQKSCLIQLKYLFLSHRGFFSQGFRMVFPTQVKGQNLNFLREVIDFKSYFSLSNETPKIIPFSKL